MPRRTLKLHGIIAAVSTPFTADGSAVDEQALTALADRMVAGGLHGIVATGSTGEFSTLSAAEHQQVIAAYVRSIGGRIPVLAGIGALSTSTAISLARNAEAAGADGLMLLPPFYGGVSWDTLTTYLEAITSSVSIPAMYYNIPSHTGTVLSAEQLSNLGNIPGLDYVKDTSGDAVKQTELLTAYAGRGAQVFNGWDTLSYSALALGAPGVVWGAASIVPELAVRFWDTLAVKGDQVTARQQWKHLWAISDFLESVEYAAGIKAGLDLIGHSAGPPRAPILPLSNEELDRLAGILSAAGVTVTR